MGIRVMAFRYVLATQPVTEIPMSLVVLAAFQ